MLRLLRWVNALATACVAFEPNSSSCGGGSIATAAIATAAIETAAIETAAITTADTANADANAETANGDATCRLLVAAFAFVVRLSTRPGVCMVGAVLGPEPRHLWVALKPPMHADPAQESRHGSAWSSGHPHCQGASAA